MAVKKGKRKNPATVLGYKLVYCFALSTNKNDWAGAQSFLDKCPFEHYNK